MSASTETEPGGAPRALEPEATAQGAVAAEVPPVPAAPPAPAVAGAAGGGFAAAVLEWFVRRRSIVRAAREAKELLPSQRELFERARSALQAAEDAREPSGMLENGPAFAPVLELCRESVYWALAFREAQSGTETVTDPPGELFELWARADQAVLLRAAADPEGLAIIEHAVARGSFAALAELPESEQRALVPRVLRFATALLRSLDVPDNTLLRLRAERARRLGALLVVLFVACVVAVVARGANEQRRDIAPGKAWKTSSRMGGCTSPKQSCGETPTYFFHTVEEVNPWVEIDLGAPVSVSAVRILNRKDCCPDRAIPLVVELSDDHVNYREVGRRTKSFMSHRVDFPTQKARWVRVRALRKTWLHLRGVMVLP